jgi:acyl carrier protein
MSTARRVLVTGASSGLGREMARQLGARGYRVAVTGRSQGGGISLAVAGLVEGLVAVAPDVPFRDQLDLDSMDYLNFVIALHAALGVEIPEADYPKLATLEACVDYLAAAAAA